jgi:hypothetical protein
LSANKDCPEEGDQQMTEAHVALQMLASAKLEKRRPREHSAKLSGTGFTRR